MSDIEGRRSWVILIDEKDRPVAVRTDGQFVITTEGKTSRVKTPTGSVVVKQRLPNIVARMLDVDNGENADDNTVEQVHTAIRFAHKMVDS